MFCFHKWGEVNDRSEQRCLKCGRIAVVPCRHAWEVRDEYDLMKMNTGRRVGFTVQLRCTHCGDVKAVNHRFKD